MTDLLTLYVLIWPAGVALSLATISYAVYRDVKAAKKNGESLV